MPWPLEHVSHVEIRGVVPPEPSAGDHSTTQACDAKTVQVQVRTINTFEFDAVDLIKLDIQGAEFPALTRSPRNDFLRNRPLVLVEEKPFIEQHALVIQGTAKLLRSWGMTAKEKAKSDRVFVFEE